MTNGTKLHFCIIFINPQMATKPLTVEAINPTTNTDIPVCSKPFRNISSNCIPPASAIIGTLMRKENSAALFLSNFENNPAVMVIPDLLVPGISANACTQPIHNEFFQLTFSNGFLLSTFNFLLIAPVALAYPLAEVSYPHPPVLYANRPNL